jgi:hypothetical protein
MSDSDRWIGQHQLRLYAQFDRLHEAARDIDGIGVNVPPGKLVYRNDENSVGARGTGVMNGLANPININRMLCVKSEGTCEITAAELDLHTIATLQLLPPTIFNIQSWTSNRITAIREHPCGTATLTVDVDAKDVTITSVPHTDLPFCSKEPANIWKLVDGFPVAWNIYLDKYNKGKHPLRAAGVARCVYDQRSAPADTPTHGRW